METVYVILYIIGAACFGGAAAGVNVRINLIGLGLLACVLVPIIRLLN